MRQTRKYRERGEEAYARWLHATILSVSGENSQAAGSMLTDAADLAAELGMKPLLAHCYLGLGDLDPSSGHRQRKSAARISGDFLSWLDELGRPDPDRPFFADCHSFHCE